MFFKEGNHPQSIILKNTLQLTLRPAQPSDAENLLVYFEQVSGESDNITFGPGEFGLSVEEEREVLQQFAEKSTSIYLIAEISGEIAGVLTFNTGKRSRLQHGGEFGLTVLRKYWKLGIGGHMLAYLIDWAHQIPTIRKINLRVRADNPSAIHLYEKYGFVHEGRITREICVRGQFFDTLFMGLQLDPPSATTF